MTRPTQTICVDIGNSGLRCVRLMPSVAADTTAASTVPWTGEVLRVDWIADGDSTATAKNIGNSLSKWLENRADTLHSSVSKSALDTRWLVSSVQRTMESHLRSFVEGRGDTAYELITYKSLEIDVQVDHPDRVGVDRLLAALAASEHCPGQPLIVIQAGSAITVDLVQPPKVFTGGAIMPGVPMMLRLLSQAADLLPPIAAKELFDLPALPGKNTTEAMNAGVSSAVVGGVRHLVRRYREQTKQDVLVVISGGDGPRLSPHVEPPVVVIEQLVLRGLALVANQNRRP